MNSKLGTAEVGSQVHEQQKMGIVVRCTEDLEKALGSLEPIFSAPDGHRASVRGASLIDVLDRVLDKGIVIDAWVRVSLVGINLITPSRGGRAVARELYQTLMPSVHAALAPGSPGANHVSASARLRAASAFIPW